MNTQSTSEFRQISVQETIVLLETSAEGLNEFEAKRRIGASEAPKDESLVLDPGEPLKVSQRITDTGYYYRAGENELGPFTVQDEQDPGFAR